jgi:hypothetical protein
LESKQQKLDRLAGRVWTYVVDVRPIIERSGDLPDLPMDRRAKGEWNPPFGDYAHLVVWVNRDASRKLRPLLDELEKHRARYKGYRFDLMLLQARYDSASFVRWLSASNAGPARRKAFWELCVLIARALVAKYGEDVVLSVRPNPSPDEDGGVVLSPSERSDDVVKDPRSISPKWRTITAMDAYRAIVARLERIREENPSMAERDVEIQCSKELHALGHNGSIGRIRDAKTALNAERGKGDAA